VTATDELRAELTKRGVEWEDMSARFPTGMLWCTSWTSQDGEPCTALEGADDIPDGKLSVQALLTPAQAIAATLGSEDTYTREDVESAFVSGYSLGLDMFDSSKPEKGWNQNKRDMEEEMEDLGWVRKDAATLGSGTCDADETDVIKCWVKCEDEPNTERMELIHVMECSACGGTYEHVSGSYEFCPRCGKKVVDE